MRRGSLALALGAALAIVASGPFIDILRAAVKAVFPSQFAVVLTGVVLVALAIALLAALTRIRDQRVVRYLALIVAVAIAVGYARAVRSGNAEVDAVERVHFIEYGILALCLYRAWWPRHDWSTFLLPLAAGLTVGLIDESVQWFVPGRVGEVHDVFLNGAAIVCGLLFGVGIEPPPWPFRRMFRASRTLVLAGAVVVAVGLTLFIYLVHAGYAVHDTEGNVFRSTWSGRALLSEAGERAQRWSDAPPVVLRRLSREDHYLSEGWWHVQERNRAVSEGRARAAWGENRILEEFFEPVLDTPSYISATGHRWSPEQREQARALVQDRGVAYMSQANPYPIFVFFK